MNQLPMLYPKNYLARRVFAFPGSAFRIEVDGQLRFYVRQKPFKLKEEITVFADEACTTPALGIQARSVLDFGATYDITDKLTGENLGAGRRQGLKSLFQDAWDILGPSGEVIGSMKEDRMLFAILRRFFSNLIPQQFVLRIGDRQVGTFRQRFNPFRLSYDVEMGEGLDPRVGVAMMVLVLAIEGRQN